MTRSLLLLVALSAAASVRPSATAPLDQRPGFATFACADSLGRATWQADGADATVADGALAAGASHCTADGARALTILD